MPTERRKRQQRVRHEAGGAAVVPAAVPVIHDSHSPAAVPDAVPTAAAKVATAAPDKSTAAEGGRGGRGAGRGSNRGGTVKPGRRGVGVATVDESQYYQPVTIMESKPRGEGDAKDNDDTDQLDEAPRKYKRRAIVSNWSRYEQQPSWDEEIDDGSDYLIGEDFSDVLTNQSLGSGGGGHLQLKGEEGWGFNDSLGDRSLLGLGALRVSDLVSTMSTVPLTMQLGVQHDKLPELLLDFYTKVADDNRRVYDPVAAADYVDDAQVLEEQMQKLRLAFFDEVPSKSNKNANRTPEAKPPKEQVSGNSLDGFMDDISGDLSTKIDFAEDLSDDVAEQKSESGKVDLTAKMCQAFGSDIKDMTDDNYVDFVADDGDLVNGAMDSGTNDKVIVSDGSHDLPKPSGNINKFNSSSENRTLRQLGEINRRSKNIENSSKTTEKTTESPGLDFSCGHQSFNFSLPKAQPAGVSVGSRPNENLKDEDVFAPSVKTKGAFESSVLGQQVDLDAPIVPKSTTLITSKEDTKELEDWLDSVLDD